jgi:HAD superfamily hydrolase (TIGR01484 family)
MIFAADVDDTVCPSTRPVESEVAKELVRLQKLGVKLVFVSGSTVPQIQEQLGAHLGVEHWLLGTTGTQAVHFSGGRASEVYRHVLDPALRDLGMAAFGRLVERHHLVALQGKADQVQDRGSQITLSAMGRHAPEAEKRAFDPDGSLRRTWIEELRGEIGGALDIHIGGTTSIDLTEPGVDKAFGLKKFLGKMGFDDELLVYFGDQLNPGGNDYPVRRLAHCVSVTGTAQSLQYLKKITDPLSLPDLPYLPGIA